MTFGSTASSSDKVGKVLPVARSLWASSLMTVGAAVSVRHSLGCTGVVQYNILWLREGIWNRPKFGSVPVK